MAETPRFNGLPETVRFVVLAHDEPAGGLHFDLMIEQGGVLATWRCPIEPEGAAAGPLAIERLADHRLHYLTYEGPISGNRGTVRRHDEGTCTVLKHDDSDWLVEWVGRNLIGRFRLRRTRNSAQSWSLAPLEK